MTDPKDLSVIIGFDISSTKIGVAVLVNGVIFELLGVQFKSKDDLFTRVDYFVDFLEEQLIPKYSQYDCKIYVEDFLRRVIPGKSSAQSLFKLAIMNGVCSYLLREKCKTEPKFVHVATARKLVVGTIPRDRKEPDTKKYVFNYIMQNNPEIKNILDQNKTRKGNYPPIAYDMCDAYVIAKAGYLIESGAEQNDSATT